MSVVRKNRLGPRIAMPSILVGAAVEHGYLALTSPPPSLNNLFATAGKIRIKSQDYKDWIAVAGMQVKRQNQWHVPGKTRIYLKFNRRQTGCDLDNLIKPVLDLLVTFGRIEDDKNVIEIGAEFDDASLGTEINVASASWKARAAA